MKATCVKYLPSSQAECGKTATERRRLRTPAGGYAYAKYCNDHAAEHDRASAEARAKARLATNSRKEVSQ